ncbi:putative histone-like DNA-binding protein [Parabacteroides sp. PH5-13]|uniref:HU family DNA-binding protein n=1 Tax=unclassified Parabacteroides TaxID=2649774 RepID=UPI0024754961|nr:MULTISPECIES: HU family DNA-binding protein [unclassified Parabacteroides]MDH6305582.1 putative histone-like DNA-binding protein [Parabacteroides sp. PH5-39]MDH6319863.1 putative histone-like DNA-binding protein [Parabacteroides sp. PH5-13]MDH6323546.1 putative histone-like DNA-binding protein [Parabacteroides sp. PH5-8]MDH6384658.1 putative histone-like DNA-binding protein [Parabacteroides sp. PH5-17]MDH6394013.1 putative histone-like DNA-binding protein [Parabacteroides sp. PFB2-22]
MSVKFRLVDRKNLGKDAKEAPRKLYAYAVNNGFVTFEELCSDIAENCTLTSADVKAVLDRMNQQLDKNLRAGRIVQFGEFGNFRMAVGSTGAVEEKDFSTSQIKTPKIVFTPGKRLRTARALTTFEKINSTVVEVECDRTHLD